MSVIALTAGLVAQATGGRLLTGAADQPFTAVSTDTRTISAGALFIALEGERFDGHAFAADAVARGATGLVIAESQAARLASGVAAASVVIAVDDTLAALQGLGREIRRQSKATVIAITGSAGKTTTKEVTADLLAARYRVYRNRGNLNNHIGLPLSLVELRSGPDVAVVELGMNHPGEIRTLVGLAEPDVRVWINVGDAHIGHFGSRAAVAAAKAEILEQATPATRLIGNADDPLVMAHLEHAVGRVVTFGTSAGASVRATSIVDRGFDGTSATVTTPSGTIAIEVPLAGRAQLLNVLAAIAVATMFDIPAAEIARRVSALAPVARRGASVRRADGMRVIDDSYNASPAAVEAMLAALAATPAPGRRVAMLGEMRELGDAALDLHAACGRAAARVPVDLLVVVGGPAADGLVDGAVAGGLAESRIRRYATSQDAAAAAGALVAPGDLVLVKGSRGTRMDVIVDRLLEVA